MWTFGEMIFLPGAASYVGDMAPDGQRGQYVGAYSMMLALMVIGLGIFVNGLSQRAFQVAGMLISSLR